MLGDIRYALRLLVKSPAFTAFVIAALGLSIGANTAIFSVVNAVLLRALPFPNSAQLVMVWQTNAQLKRTGFQFVPTSIPNLVEWRANARSFEGLAGFEGWTANLSGEGPPERVVGARTSANILALLAVQPMLGRGFLPDEDQIGRNHVVLLSAALWRRRFGGDPTAVGRSLTLDQQVYTVVGVMPDSFRFPDDTGLPSYMAFGGRCEIWTPLVAETDRMTNRAAHNLAIIGRLKNGVGLRAAQSEASAIALSDGEQFPDTDKDWGIALVSLQEQAKGGIQGTLLILEGAGACMLLIACANVANLLLARALLRRKEIGVRSALGATPYRLVRQLLTESVLLAFFGAVAGLVCAILGSSMLARIAPATLPRLGEIRVDATVLCYTLGISLLSGLLFGLVPALQSARPDLNSVLKESGRGSTGSRHPLLSALVVLEIAMTLALLICAGLLIGSFVKLQQTRAGFDTSDLLTFTITLPSASYTEPAKIAAFYAKLTRQLEAIPGVQSACASNALPLSGSEETDMFEVEGQPKNKPGEPQTANFRYVTPHYFRAMKIPQVRGDTLPEAAREGARAVAVVDESMARVYFPDATPIGKRLFALESNAPRQPIEIIGVVGDVRHSSIGEKPVPHIYIPHAQNPVAGMTFAVRSAGHNTSAFLPAIRREVASVDGGVSMAEIKTMQQMVSTSVATPRFATLLLTAFAALALTLALFGIYAVISNSVTQRQAEIEIRFALGARRHQILALILRQSMSVTLAGVVIGLCVSWAAIRVMRSSLFSLVALQPIVVGAIVLSLVATALLASYIPARSASRVNPAGALRSA